MSTEITANTNFEQFKENLTVDDLTCLITGTFDMLTNKCNYCTEKHTKCCYGQCEKHVRAWLLQER